MNVPLFVSWVDSSEMNFMGSPGGPTILTTESPQHWTTWYIPGPATSDSLFHTPVLHSYFLESHVLCNLEQKNMKLSS